MLVLFTVFERPSWCFPAPGADGVDVLAGVRRSPLSFLTRGQSIAIEVTLLVLLLVDSLLSKIQKSPGSRWSQSLFRPLRVAALLIALLDVVVFDAAFPNRTFRLSPHLRPLVAMCTFRSVRRVVVNVMRALPDLLRVVFLYALWIFFMAFVGMVLFADNADVAALYQGGPIYFQTYAAALWGLQVCNLSLFVFILVCRLSLSSFKNTRFCCVPLVPPPPPPFLACVNFRF